MRVTDFVDQLEVDARLMAQAARAAGADAPVEPTPGWTVRDLVAHTGEVHRWAIGIIGGAERQQARAKARDSVPGRDDALFDWFDAGRADLVRTLRTADPLGTCWTFLPAPSGVAFWARRQAHETAIHRVDAETAAGWPISAVDSGTGLGLDFALDGIDEVLAGMMTLRSRGIDTDRPRTLAVRPAGGPDWLVTLTPDSITGERTADPDAEATVAGPPVEIYRWLWNRPARVSLDGEQAVTELWRRVRVR